MARPRINFLMHIGSMWLIRHLEANVHPNGLASHTQSVRNHLIRLPVHQSQFLFRSGCDHKIEVVAITATRGRIWEFISAAATRRRAYAGTPRGAAWTRGHVVIQLGLLLPSGGFTVLVNIARVIPHLPAKHPR